MRLMLLLACLCQTAFAQKVTITGYVEDAASGEALIGANVYETNTLAGASSNVYGFYSLTLPPGKHSITASFVGYKSKVIELELLRDTLIKFRLEQAIELKEVEISAAAGEKIQEKIQMSAIEVPVEQIKNLPVLLGERDVLKVVQLLPGVQSGGEGTTGFYVRGGGPDQNLVLLDGVPVYNASHLFGFFSVFNADAINSVTLIKGGFPARYGGRLSSVLDIRMKEGNMKEFHGEGSIGLVSSKLTLEGPIVKDKTSFIVSGRRTYIDLLAQPIIKATMAAGGGEGGAGYYFYDLNAKINHVFNDRHRLFLSAYTGDDKAYARLKDDYIDNNQKYVYRDDAGLGWGNLTTALRWNWLIGKKSFSNLTATYSRYRFYVQQEHEFETVGISKDYYRFRYTSAIRDFGLRYDLDFVPSTRHTIRAGAGTTYHTFTPGINTFNARSGTTTEIDTSFGQQDIKAIESFAYLEDEMKLGGRVKLNPGVHFSSFHVGKSAYWSVQPRISARFLITEKLSVKASAATMAQYLHLLTNAGIGLPTDLWVPVTDTIKPQLSRQVAAGAAYTHREQYEFSVEGYYKQLENLIEYKEGASFFGSSANWQEKVEFGSGETYGAEFLLQKKKGRLSGWIGYTLSWSIRNFPNLNFGESFPYRYDRRHDIGIAATWQFNDRIDAGLVFVYGTGNAITLPSSRYLINPGMPWIWFGGEIENYRSRNGFRMPSYHRLDLGVNFRKEKKWGERTWSLGLYNAYNRRNPFYLFHSYDDYGRRVIKMYSLFPVIPSVTYSFKF